MGIQGKLSNKFKSSSFGRYIWWWLTWTESSWEAPENSYWKKHKLKRELQIILSKAKILVSQQTSSYFFLYKNGVLHFFVTQN